MDIAIPHSRLTNYLKTDALPADIAHYLSLCGPTVDAIEPIKTDYLYHLEVITNRVDAASAWGIAREAAAILPEFGFSATLIPPQFEQLKNILESPSLSPLKLTVINQPQLNPRILAIKIDQVKVAPSPGWLIDTLAKYGQRPLNNLIDITNFVMFELGHPVHVFDYDRLTTKKIIVREAKKGEALETLDHKSITLQGGEIIYDDGTGQIIDLPGIMGTANTVVTPQTKTALLWIEDNNSQKIRQASLTHQLRTHAAILNEKNVDPESSLVSLKYCLQLAQKYAHGHVGSQIFDLYPQPYSPKHLTLNLDWLENFSGIKLSVTKIKAILQRLDLKPNLTTPNTITCQIPSHRHHDLNLPEDLAEEILRIYGYFRLPSSLPCSHLKHLPFKTPLDYEYQAKLYLTHLGFTEVYNYSLISRQTLDTYHFKPSQLFRLTNPLSSDFEYMRPAILPSLIDNLSHNQNYHSPILSLFELAHVYLASKKSSLAQEIPHLAFIQTNSHFLQTKGYLEALSHQLGCFLTYAPVTRPPSYFNPNQVAIVSVNNQPIGYLGQIGHQPTFGVEIDFSMLIKTVKDLHHFSPISPHTPIIEDLTFTLPPKSLVGPIINHLRNLDPLIHQVDLKTTYHQNYTFTLTYQSPTNQLTDQKIAPIRQQIVTTLKRQFKAVLVGKLV